jgi:hypothetical protein
VSVETINQPRRNAPGIECAPIVPVIIVKLPLMESV